MSQTIRIGTRRSKLAMWQARWVQALLQEAHPGLCVEIQPIVTQGDRQSSASLSRIGGKGVFIKEIEDALLRDEIDIAVHSMKDVPTDLPEDLMIGSVPKRADVRDAFVSRTGKRLADLAVDSRVGTGSPRRKAQLAHIRPDLQILDIRGNVDTRLRKLDEGLYDAIILAAAGLQRLGLDERIDEAFAIEQMVPAVGQAAVGIECRIADALTRECIGVIDHAQTSIAVRAERAFLAHLGGGCQQPIGATALLEAVDQLMMIGMVATDEGIHRETTHGAPDEPELAGIQLAEKFT